MLGEATIQRIDEYWASYFGCAAAELFRAPFRIATHGPMLADYRGILALFRHGAAMVSIPPEDREWLHAAVAAQFGADSIVAETFGQAWQRRGETVIGPASIAYADVVAAPMHAARSLKLEDTPAIQALCTACTRLDWEHGGCEAGTPASGVFVGGRLVSQASYEVWGAVIAHISIVTHPEHRGHGFGRSAVAHLTARALTADLVPQYRTLESNQPSRRIAESLGFHHYATSVAVRLGSVVGE